MSHDSVSLLWCSSVVPKPDASSDCQFSARAAATLARITRALILLRIIAGFAGLIIKGGSDEERRIRSPRFSEKRDGRKRSCRNSLTTAPRGGPDRKSTRLNSSHPSISYAVFCLKKKTKSALRFDARRSKP